MFPHFCLIKGILDDLLHKKLQEYYFFLVYSIVAKNFVISNGSPQEISKVLLSSSGDLIARGTKILQDNTGKIAL